MKVLKRNPTEYCLKVVIFRKETKPEDWVAWTNDKQPMARVSDDRGRYRGDRPGTFFQ